MNVLRDEAKLTLDSIFKILLDGEKGVNLLRYNILTPPPSHLKYTLMFSMLFSGCFSIVEIEILYHG